MCYKMMLQLGVVLCMFTWEVEVQQVTTPFDPLSTTLHHYPAGWPQRRFREVTNTCEKLGRILSAKPNVLMFSSHCPDLVLTLNFTCTFI